MAPLGLRGPPGQLGDAGVTMPALSLGLGRAGGLPMFGDGS